jgi:hypothetical protein
MTEPRFFVRNQGRVSGPFTIGQIRALHQRGHFGRFHEVSPDQRSWQPAGELPELFPVPTPPTLPVPAPAPPPPAPVAPPTEPSVPLQTLANEEPLVTPTSSQEVDWYYQGPEGEPQGPLSLAHLERLRIEGSVTDATLVCKPGMDTWIELSTALGGHQPVASVAPPAAPAPTGGRGRVRFALLLALGGGGASLLGLLPLLLGYLLGWSSKPGAPLVGFYAILLFAALTAEATAYVCCLLSPLGGAGRRLAASAFLLALTELFVRGGAIGFLGLVGILPAPEWVGGTLGELMVGALSVALSCGRTVLFQFYLCQVARDLRRPQVVRSMLQSLPLLGGAVVLYLLFLLGVLIGTAADLNAADRGAFEIAYLIGLVLVGGVWVLWYLTYLVSLYRLQVVVEDEE